MYRRRTSTATKNNGEILIKTANIMNKAMMWIMKVMAFLMWNKETGKINNMPNLLMVLEAKDIEEEGERIGEDLIIREEEDIAVISGPTIMPMIMNTELNPNKEEEVMDSIEVN